SGSLSCSLWVSGCSSGEGVELNELAMTVGVAKAIDGYLGVGNRISVFIDDPAGNDALRSHFDVETGFGVAGVDDDGKSGARFGAGSVAGGEKSSFIGGELIAAGGDVVEDEFPGVVRGGGEIRGGLALEAGGLAEELKLDAGLAHGFAV